MVPANLAHYRILGVLGAGGMGEVYVAEDTKLGRKIALKVLAHETTPNPGRRTRFEREARAVAALNHPNIVTIHSVEEHEGLLFLTMELVEGRTLDHLIPQGGMPLDELLKVAIPLADAVGTAHQRGITHRDLKPANVMVSDDGRVKVLDFGLATLADQSPAGALSAGTRTEQLTIEGQIVGTIAYMSPEQAQGKRVDQRSDIFSLGTVLFEMATGQKPFNGDTQVSLLSAILKDAPTPANELRPELPTSFVRILTRCLSKDPEDRYQTGKDLRNDLRACKADFDSAAIEPAAPISVSSTGAPKARATFRRPRTAAALIALAVLVTLVAAVTWWYPLRRESGPTRASSHTTVAVLPFENFSRDPDRDYLADGLADETIEALGQIDAGISVIARTSTFGYRGTKKSIADIGRELRADYIVEGSIRSETGRLRVTSRLVRAIDQVQMWSKSYDRAPTSVLATQLELSSAIAEQIRLRLLPDRVTELSHRQTNNPEAYDLYLRGRYFWRQRRPETNARALQYFQEAIKLDPNYALAWALIADTYANSPINSDAPPMAVVELARDASRHAVEAEANLAEVQYVRGNIAFMFDWNWADAEASIRRAIALDPHDDVSQVLLAHLLTRMGRYDEALAATRLARELNPLEPLNHALSSQVAFEARDYAAAVEHARRATEMGPDFWIGYIMLAQAYGQVGEVTKAFDALATAARLSEDNSMVLSLKGYLLAHAGREKEARAVLRTLEARARDRYVPPLALAFVHAGLGDRDDVFVWLDRAVAARDVHLVFLPVDPKWDPYASDPRFERILARCGFSRPPAPASR